MEAILSVADMLPLGFQGRLIGVMVALDESDLHNYYNPRVPGSETFPNDGPPPHGGDLDSLGLFQQRTTWWGTGSVEDRVRQLMTPTTAAQLFFAALLRIPQWQQMDPWVAAQTVQHSAFPDGSNYRARLGQAEWVLAHLPDPFTRYPKEIPSA